MLLREGGTRSHEKTNDLRGHLHDDVVGPNLWDRRLHVRRSPGVTSVLGGRHTQECERSPMVSALRLTHSYM